MLKDLLRREIHGLVEEFRTGSVEAMGAKVKKLDKQIISDADFKARTAIIDDIEKEIEKNFSTIGSRVKKQKKEKGNLVDKLKDL
jgi:hypothetical protein